MNLLNTHLFITRKALHTLFFDSWIHPKLTVSFVSFDFFSLFCQNSLRWYLLSNVTGKQWWNNVCTWKFELITRTWTKLGLCWRSVQLNQLNHRFLHTLHYVLQICCVYELVDTCVSVLWCAQCYIGVCNGGNVLIFWNFFHENQCFNVLKKRSLVKLKLKTFVGYVKPVFLQKKRCF